MRVGLPYLMSFLILVCNSAIVAATSHPRGAGDFWSLFLRALGRLSVRRHQDSPGRWHLPLTAQPPPVGLGLPPLPRRSPPPRSGELGLLVLVLSGLALMPAWAGHRLGSQVAVDLQAGVAHGSIGAARNSGDAVQYIGCRVTARVGAQPAVLCFARDAAGTYLQCQSEERELIRAVQTIAPWSWIYFEADGPGRCLLVRVETASYYEVGR